MTTLVSFHFNGKIPFTGLIADAAGSLFGTTTGGVGTGGNGTIFELSGSDHKTLTTLYTFTGGADGSTPDVDLIADGAGNLYGTTPGNGANGPSTVFELSGTGFAVPEPGSLALMGLGLAGLLGRRRGGSGCQR